MPNPRRFLVSHHGGATLPELAALFSAYGTVIDGPFNIDADKGFVEFATAEAATAVTAPHPTGLQGRPLRNGRLLMIMYSKQARK